MLLFALLLLCPVFINAAPVPGRQLEKYGNIFNNLFGKKPAAGEAKLAASRREYAKQASMIDFEADQLLRHPNGSPERLFQFQSNLKEFEYRSHFLQVQAASWNAFSDIEYYKDTIGSLKAKETYAILQRIQTRKKQESSIVTSDDDDIVDQDGESSSGDARSGSASSSQGTTSSYYTAPEDDQHSNAPSSSTGNRSRYALSSSRDSGNVAVSKQIMSVLGPRISPYTPEKLKAFNDAYNSDPSAWNSRIMSKYALSTSRDH